MFCELRRGNDEIINISSQNGAEGVVTQMLPKSHISHVILNANVSEERFLDMKVSSQHQRRHTTNNPGRIHVCYVSVMFCGQIY